MKVVVYSVRPFEKEFLARANQKGTTSPLSQML